jgi:vesicle coat complex subunit
LAELREYAQEVDVDFVRKAVSCIGQVALRLETASQKCVEALLELIKLKVAYVVQEAVVVIRVCCQTRNVHEFMT